MASATIPVDLRNPGQVFACLGLMEAAELLCGHCEGRFGYRDSETRTTFTLSVDGENDPIVTVIEFLRRAQAKAVAPKDSTLSTAKWDIETIYGDDHIFPSGEPDSPAALPVLLTDGQRSISFEHWVDAPQAGLDSLKFWAGAGGYPGAGLARDALQALAGLGDSALGAAAADPFSVEALQSSSFRFDWRRDYIPLDAGFSPNAQASVKMVGYPFVELLAVAGLQHARPQRPDRRDKLMYRYGVSSMKLPTQLVRAVLGAESLGFPMRVFLMRLGWPGQEGQARCIIDAQEGFAT